MGKTYTFHDATAATGDNAEAVHALERRIAYQAARAGIEVAVPRTHDPLAPAGAWYDLMAVPSEHRAAVAESVAYLDAIGLLQRHDQNLHCVRPLDDSLLGTLH